MPNVIDKKTRSRIMSSIRSRNTKVEWMLRRALWKEGLRYGVHYGARGCPDMAFPSRKVAVFVDGDFWHGHNWKKLRPKLKNKFWIEKIKRNIARDKEVNAELIRDGWQVIRIWEHDLRNDTNQCVRRIQKILECAK